MVFFFVDFSLLTIDQFELMLQVDHLVQLNQKDFEINVNLSLSSIWKIGLFCYSLAGFESRNGPRQPSGNNNNRSGGGFRPSGRGGNQQHGVPQMIDGYYENGYIDGKKNFYMTLYFENVIISLKIKKIEFFKRKKNNLFE